MLATENSSAVISIYLPDRTDSELPFSFPFHLIISVFSSHHSSQNEIKRSACWLRMFTNFWEAPWTSTVDESGSFGAQNRRSASLTDCGCHQTSKTYTVICLQFSVSAKSSSYISVSGVSMSSSITKVRRCIGSSEVEFSLHYETHSPLLYQRNFRVISLFMFHNFLDVHVTSSSGCNVPEVATKVVQSQRCKSRPYNTLFTQLEVLLLVSGKKSLAQLPLQTLQKKNSLWFKLRFHLSFAFWCVLCPLLL